jgi:hypothetical protein
MTDTPDHSSANDSETKPSPALYSVGYGKPPVEHRFKPGNKANPRGRGKGARNRKVVIREVLCEPVTVREGAETRQMPLLEAVIKKMASKALTGDNKAAATLIGIAHKEGLLTSDQGQMVEDLSDSDQAIIADFKRRMEGATLDIASEIPVEGGGS